jgi:hypothetical protein
VIPKNNDLQKKVQVGGTATPSGFAQFRYRFIAFGNGFAAVPIPTACLRYAF